MFKIFLTICCSFFGSMAEMQYFDFFENASGESLDIIFGSSINGSLRYKTLQSSQELIFSELEPRNNFPLGKIAKTPRRLCTEEGFVIRNIRASKIYDKYELWLKIPHVMLINNVIPRTRKKGELYYTAEHFYTIDDKVTVECISLFNTCTVQIKDSLSGALVDISGGAEVWGRGYPTTLQANHNGRELVCVSNCQGVKTTVKVKFVLQKKSETIMTIKINNQKVILTNTSHNDNIYYYNYGYFMNESNQVTVTCEADHHIDIAYSYESCLETGLIKQKNNGTLTLRFHNTLSILTLTAKFKNETRIQEKVILLFQAIKAINTSYLALTISPKKNMTSEFYDYEYNGTKSFIHYTYKYENFEVVSLNCSKQNAPKSTYIIGNGTDLMAKENSFLLNISLNLTHNNTIVTCSLNDYKANKIITQVRVLFLMSPSSLSRSYDNAVLVAPLPETDNQILVQWQGLMFGILIGSVLVSIPVAFLCKLKSRYNCRWQRKSLKNNIKYDCNSHNKQQRKGKQENENLALRSQLVASAIYNNTNEIPEHVESQKQFSEQDMIDYDYVMPQKMKRTKNFDTSTTGYTDMTHNQYVECYR